MTSTHVTVSGMTCEHCVRAVTEELNTLPEVTDVTIDLDAGGHSPVTITSSAPLDPTAIRAAVEEAGYTATV